MFDVGWSELVVIGVVALVVIGPKELPGVIRTVGRSIARLRTMAGEFRTQFDDAMREAELHDVKKTFTDVATGASSVMDPIGTIRNEIKSAVEEAKSSALASSGATEAHAAITGMEAEVKSLAEARAAAEVPLDLTSVAAPPAAPEPEAVVAAVEDPPVKLVRARKAKSGDAA